MGYSFTIEPGSNNSIGKPITYGELDAEALRNLKLTIKNMAKAVVIKYPSSTTEGRLFSFTDNGGVNFELATFGGRGVSASCSDTVLSVSYMTPTEMIEHNSSTANYWSDAVRGDISTRFIQMYDSIRRFILMQTLGTNISDVYSDLCNYDWVHSSQSIYFDFNTGQRFRSSRASSSSYNLILASGSGTSNYGVLDCPLQKYLSPNGRPVNGAYSRANNFVSMLFFSKQETPEESVRLAVSNNRVYFYKNTLQYVNTNSNGDITVKRGRTAEIISCGTSNYIYLFDTTVTPEFFEIEEIFEDSDNTYPGGGDDKNTYPEDGESGKGTFDNTNDPVDFPTLPTWDATNTGFISMWNPSIAEITSLYGFLWDSDISITLKKLFLEPMDAVISLAFFPVEPTIDSRRNVTIGHVDSEIEMNHVQKQFVSFDFGSIQLDEYYGAAWDYSPYTKVSIYLPYIGTHEIDIDDVMNSTLTLRYTIDLLSGICVAMLKVDRDRDGLDAILYTWQGNCAMQVPVSAGSARDFLNSIIQLGAMTGISVAQPAAGSIDAAMHKGDENYKSPAMGNNWINPAITAFAALNVLGQKIHVQRGGRVDANAGVISPQEAFIIINRPVSAIPKGWNNYAGYPSLKIKTLGTQTGYTEVGYIKLNDLEATADEISELDGMLKGGVIL